MADDILVSPSTAGTAVSVRAKEISGKLYSAILLADTAGAFYTPNAITQNVQLSSSNNRSSTLGTGLSWSGTGESTLNCAGLQINFEGDQHATITVYQSQDNLTWLIADQFDYQKNAAFGTTVQATASYFYVKVKNESSGTLTYKLQSVLCPIVEAVPRSLDNFGNFKVSTQDIRDRFTNNAIISPVGDLRVSQPYRLVGATFGAAVDSNFWTLTSSGTGASAAVASDVCTLTSGTSDSGYAQAITTRTARFTSIAPHQFRANIVIPTLAVASNTRRWGAFTVSTVTPQNGFYYELSAAGALSVNCVSGASVTTVASGSFNGSVPEYVMDTNVHTYDIVYRNTKVLFIIDNVLVHTFTATNARLAATMHLQACATSVNGTSAASGVIQCWSMIIVRLGRDTTAPTTRYQSGTTAGVVCKLGPGKLHSITISAVANGAVITLYDNTTATGTVLWSSGTIVVAVGQNPGIVNIAPPDGWPFFTGLSFAITTAAMNATIAYE